MGERDGARALACGKVSRQCGWIEDRLNEVVTAALLKRVPEPPRELGEDLSEEIDALEERIRLLRQRWKEGGMADEDYYDSLAHLCAPPGPPHPTGSRRSSRHSEGDGRHGGLA